MVRRARGKGRAVYGKAVAVGIVKDEGVASPAVVPPAGGSAAQANKVGEEGPETGDSEASAGSNDSGGMRGIVGGADAERIHAPPAAVHGLNCRKAHHLPHAGQPASQSVSQCVTEAGVGTPNGAYTQS